MSVRLRRISPGAWKTPLAPGEIRNVLRAMLAVLGNSDRAVDVALADDAAMAEWNMKSLARPGPANILSFPSAGNEPASLIVNFDALERECLLYEQEPETHALRLLAHGIVHILGHDHGPLMDALAERAEKAGRAALPRW